MANPIFHKALLAVDESEQSYRAVEKTAELAAAGVIENLVLFNVYDSGSVDVTKLHSREKLDELRQNSVALLKKYKGILKEKGVHCTLKRAGGAPAALIMDLIENDGGYDLVIMGSRRLNKFQELAFGSVSDKITRLVSIPVLIVK
ncbi:MAG: universal stress protein [Syntrophomonadaceae bacterium]|nr:universal stress protein [Syntrophomonadaceae bacterium]